MLELVASTVSAADLSREASGMLCLHDRFSVNASADVNVAAVLEGTPACLYLLKHLLRWFVVGIGWLPELSIQVRLKREVC